MKKFLLALCVLMLLSGCGGSYSITSGKADEGAISFTSEEKIELSVTIDGKDTFNVESVKTKVWKKDRNIKKTAKNTISVTPGTHEISVTAGDEKILSKKVFISANEHKVIEL